MHDRTFRRALYWVLGVCLALTAAHLAYAVYAYRHCSIISWIAGELW